MDKLCSVGLDVGTTTTQLIVSELMVENRASGFAVPEMTITDRKIRYESPVRFTPLRGDALVDGEALRDLVEEEYAKAGITPEDVDTGAVIVTGETSRKENARAVLENLSALAGEFVVATAGPALESVLAARGAGAVLFSQKTGTRVLHVDIGGGTSNLALVEAGKILRTGCLNVGGRLVKCDSQGKVSYVSPVLRGLTDLAPGDWLTEERAAGIAVILVQALEMAAGLRECTPLLEQLWTRECGETWEPVPEDCVLSFSGGVADCIEQGHPAFAFGDIGPVLGKTIQNSRLCRGQYRLGSQTIRATVIGAGCHSAQLSGSTVFYRNVLLPLKNLPAVTLTEKEACCPEILAQKLRQQDTEAVVLAVSGELPGNYSQVRRMAQGIAEGIGLRPVYVCLEADMAKALGQCLSLLLPPGRPCLCVDRIRLGQGDYLDVGQPVGPAFPVVVKTLILSQ